MPSRKKSNENSLLPLAERILKDQGLSVSDWKRSAIQTQKLAVLGDMDKQWEASVLEEAAIKVVKEAYGDNGFKKNTGIGKTVNSEGGAGHDQFKNSSSSN